MSTGAVIVIAITCAVVAWIAGDDHGTTKTHRMWVNDPEKAKWKARIALLGEQSKKVKP